MTRPKYINTLKEHSVLVVLPRADGKRGPSKQFNPDEDETSDQLIERAKRWRDSEWAKLYGGVVPEKSYHKRARVGSETQVPGVIVMHRKLEKEGKICNVPYVFARIDIPAQSDGDQALVRKTKTYAINKYGRDEAIKLAAEWREQQIKLSNAKCGKSSNQRAKPFDLKQQNK
jgi:hypothetical protein